MISFFLFYFYKPKLKKEVFHKKGKKCNRGIVFAGLQRGKYLLNMFRAPGSGEEVLTLNF